MGTTSLIDSHWMQYAAQLAAQVTERQVSPNPRVGCVVLNAAGQLVGQGYHQQAGTPHAEVHALASAGEQAKAGTLYVTLEPCNHQGKTPPCTQAIIQAGIKRVIFGIIDPNPVVAGQGIALLQNAGITVEGPCQPDICTALNPVFNHHIRHQRPFTAVKLATTLDGYMVDHTGQSQWITGPEARHHVHQQRARFMGIVSTAKTILADNSQLTARLDPPLVEQPIRVVLDQHGRLLDHPSLAIWQMEEAPTWVMTTCTQAYRQKQPQVKVLPFSTDLALMWSTLYQQGLTSLWVEAGPQFTSAVLAEPTLTQQLWWYRSGTLLGSGQSAIQWQTPLTLADASNWLLNASQAFGNDLVTVHQPDCQKALNLYSQSE